MCVSSFFTILYSYSMLSASELQTCRTIMHNIVYLRRFLVILEFRSSEGSTCQLDRYRYWHRTDTEIRCKYLLRPRVVQKYRISLCSFSSSKFSFLNCPAILYVCLFLCLLISMNYRSIGIDEVADPYLTLY